MEVRWSSRAEVEYDTIIGHLLDKWTEKEALRFISLTLEAIVLIQGYPSIGPRSSRFPEVRKRVITKQVTMFYNVKGDILHVVSFWNTLQDPTRLKV